MQEGYDEEHKIMISRLDLTTNTSESLKQGGYYQAQNRPNESWDMIDLNGQIVEQNRNMEDTDESDEVPDEMDLNPGGHAQGRISVGGAGP